MTLVWFVADALTLAELPEDMWLKLPRVSQIILIRKWEEHVKAKDDYVKRAFFMRRGK